MRTRTSLASLLLLALLGSPLGALAQPLYTITFLPAWLNISALNNAGQMSGVMPVPGGAHAFLFTNGDVRDLGTLGGPRSFAYGISDNGMVTGDASTASGASHAFAYADGAMRDLGTFPGGGSSLGRGINSAGQVTGLATTSADQAHAFLYVDGDMRDLGTLGGNFSYGAAINSAGHVVGASTVGNDGVHHAFLYRDGVMSDLGTMGGKGSFAEGINDHGQIIGGMQDHADVVHPFIYAEGVVHFLGDFGGSYTGAWDINNLGQVVGYSTYTSDIQSRHGFLYTEGKMLDINNLIDPALGWTVALAVGINDARQIAAYACNTAELCRPVRLDPVTPQIPEPGRVAMLLTGLVLGGLWHARRNTGRHASAAAKPTSL